MKNIKESYEIHKKWTSEISATNDFILKEMDKELNVALINLQIEDSRIEECTGIVPISEHIKRVINKIRDRVEKLKLEGRAENDQAIKDIKEYIEEKEGIKIDE
ncbi:MULTISPECIES: hypothetical protein [Bacteria]|uniref:hypothetical protein n=1 Tax=Bacteria TaxID=2 RepID=UPI0012B17F33|nr:MULTISPECIES: hypothetical protein [Bacteria]MRY42826.1 hypothetical protein [Parabacteroides distasonis]MZK53349.1 hypothetical protein [Clostridium beijerinckii]MZK61454.1 hypothetical protein [Clostridium beijerinckii]MZK71696.1 hypothetical protein [Clostridium beijerinckii]MZK77089.1 hypothetical protein [Clostridium beijerinckii]